MFCTKDSVFLHFIALTNTKELRIHQVEGRADEETQQTCFVEEEKKSDKEVNSQTTEMDDEVVNLTTG